MSLNTWLKEVENSQDANKKVTEEVTNEIIKLLKGIDRAGCIPKILANVFENIEGTKKSDGVQGFSNHLIDSSLEIYAGRKINFVTKELLAVYEYCVEEKYTEDNTWEWGGGDREVCFIPSENKKVLYFKNQNVRFVVVFDKHDVHVREVFKSIFDENYHYSFKGTGFKSTDELREGLKLENGLEIAICNLTGKYTNFANNVNGNEYPDRFDLESMKNTNFDKTCGAFRYGDNRDSGYLMSINNFTAEIIGATCELKDINQANYVFHDMKEVINSLPKSFLKKYKRNNSIKDILK